MIWLDCTAIPSGDLVFGIKKNCWHVMMSNHQATISDILPHLEEKDKAFKEKRTVIIEK